MKIIIMSVTAGEGHNSTARAMRDYFTSRGAHAEVLDTYGYVSPAVMHSINKTYLWASSHAKSAWKWGYRLAEKRRTLRELENGTLVRIPQDHAAATYEPKMDKELGRIDWSRTAHEVDCLVRGVTPWPGAFTTLGDQTIKVFELAVREGAPSGEPGMIVSADAKSGLVVSCADHDVEILTIQMPGAKRMNAADYLRGHSIDAGICLGKA